MLRVVDSVDAAVGLIAARLPADREGLAAAIEATGSPAPERVDKIVRAPADHRGRERSP